MGIRERPCTELATAGAEAAPQPSTGGAQLTTKTGRFADESEKLVGARRLLDYREGSGGRCASFSGGIRTAGNDDDGQVVTAAAQLFKHLKAVHTRHVYVEDQAIAVDWPDGVEEASAAAKFKRSKALSLEQDPHRVSCRIVIVYDEYHGDQTAPVHFILASLELAALI